ncbi:hypothetical protein LTR27_003542 [Elasticomyces elasticus]|nr:hypothetical protein LTR27_003542 [Elasticomyces elasticus]
MALATSTANTAALSGGAPSSHKERRHKRVSDPFLDLDDDAVKLPDQPTANDSSPANGKDVSPSLLVDLILTPISMISLLLSLVLVGERQKQWRLSTPVSLWARLSHWRSEPYQDSQVRGHGGAPGADGSFSGWYIRKKHRALAKLELNEALELRGRVLLALLAWFIFGLFGFMYAVRRFYGWLSA